MLINGALIMRAFLFRENRPYSTMVEYPRKHDGENGITSKQTWIGGDINVREKLKG